LRCQPFLFSEPNSDWEQLAAAEYLILGWCSLTGCALLWCVWGADFVALCHSAEEESRFSLFSVLTNELWISISGFESLGGSQFVIKYLPLRASRKNRPVVTVSGNYRFAYTVEYSRTTANAQE
jgi:hypothetical protein